MPLAAIGGYWAAIGGYWRLLAAMAAIGGYWRLSAAIGGYWRLLAAIGGHGNLGSAEVAKHSCMDNFIGGHLAAIWQR